MRAENLVHHLNVDRLIVDHQQPQLAQYLVLGCEGLPSRLEQDELRSWVAAPTVPDVLRDEIAAVVATFPKS